jgi:hypothetical protein
MITIIDQEWLPCERTRKALKDRFITQSQYRPIVMQFRRENNGKEVENANTKFLKLFDKMMGHAVPKPDLSAEKLVDEQRDRDIDNKSDSSKAEEVRALQPGALTRPEAIAFYMRGRS